MNEFQADSPEVNEEDELATPPVEIAANSEERFMNEGIPRPMTTPTMKVQS